MIKNYKDDACYPDIDNVQHYPEIQMNEKLAEEFLFKYAKKNGKAMRKEAVNVKGKKKLDSEFDGTIAGKRKIESAVDSLIDDLMG